MFTIEHILKPRDEISITSQNICAEGEKIHFSSSKITYLKNFCCTGSISFCSPPTNSSTSIIMGNLGNAPAKDSLKCNKKDQDLLTRSPYGNFLTPQPSKSVSNQFFIRFRLLFVWKSIFFQLERKEKVAIPNDVHGRPVGPDGKGVRDDSLPGCVHTRRAGQLHQADRSQGAGVVPEQKSQMEEGEESEKQWQDAGTHQQGPVETRGRKRFGY